MPVVSRVQDKIRRTVRKVNRNKAVRRVKNVVVGSHRLYRKSRELPLLERTCLFEPGQGKNLNGNMFALARELAWNPEFKDFEAVFVTVEENQEAAEKRLAAYGIEARVVIRQSDEYDELLARAAFLFTDNSFPPYFYKREGQVYVNTWHGTPLKQLGLSNIENSIASIANVQKNFLAADYALFPNELTRRCFMQDYRLGALMSGKAAMADYPRNDVLSDAAVREVVREREGLADKRVVAYMPTWRGGARKADVAKQLTDARVTLAELDELLDDSVVVCVNMHFLISESIDYSSFEHVRGFPADLETYDFLAACDVLVTDFSSVFFDFAVTGRKIVLFPYDKEEYLQEVGTYLPYDSLPFPQAQDVAALAREVSNPAYAAYPKFQEEYCRYHNGKASRDLLAQVCFGEDALPKVDQLNPPAARLRYIPTVSKAANMDYVQAQINESWPENGVLVMRGGNVESNVELLKNLPEDVGFLSTTTYRALDGLPLALQVLARRSRAASRLSKQRLAQAYAPEFDRVFSGVKPQSVELLAPRDEYMNFVLGAADCEKIAYVDDLIFDRRGRLRRFAAAVDEGGFDVQPVARPDASELSEEARLTYYNGWITPRMLTRKQANGDGFVGLDGIIAVRVPRSAPGGTFSIELPEGLKVGDATVIGALKGWFLLSYRIRVLAEIAYVLPEQNALKLRYTAPSGLSGKANIRYWPINAPHDAQKRLEPIVDLATGRAVYFRHSAKNFLYLTVRDTGWMKARIINKTVDNTEGVLGLTGTLVFKAAKDDDNLVYDLALPDGMHVGDLTEKGRVLGWRICDFDIRVPADSAGTLPTQNAVLLRCTAGEESSSTANVDWSVIDLHQSARLRLDPVIDEENETTLFFRHSAKNFLYLTVREVNPSDREGGMQRVDRAWLWAETHPLAPEHRAIVLFEKNASRYEESASVVYERLIDAGYDNARFVIDQSCPYLDEIPEKYRAGLVWKGSEEHYRLFFAARTFIGSEALAHSIELRSSSDHIAERLADPTLNYVFLQHGVMYMVSLDSASRGMFKPRRTSTGKFRVVTSSQLEKAHFVDLGGYRNELVYVCGLPKFDRNRWDESADLVTIMPTWRPWESNAARTDFTETGYYSLIERIVSAVPERLKDKIVVLPHPLFKQYAEGADFELRDYVDFESRYGDILERTKLLITDYSSIAYDAFYRGANVVFYWADLDECMEAYGENTHLMIDEVTAPGDVCRDTESLREAIERAYANGQSSEYVHRYRQIVEFHDGHNADRLIEMMKEDEII